VVCWNFLIAAGLDCVILEAFFGGFENRGVVLHISLQELFNLFKADQRLKNQRHQCEFRRGLVFRRRFFFKKIVDPNFFFETR
jgi:hypothetical protein